MTHSMLPPFDGRALVSTWQWQPVWDLLVLLALVLYVAGLRAARRHGPEPVPPWRVGCFVAGLVVLVLSLDSAIGVYAHALFWDHMVQHLLLIMVVPALLVLGHPLSVLVAATRGRTRRRVERVLVSPPVALVTHPIVGLAFYAAVIVATHLTSFMDSMAMHPWLHPTEQALYLVSGYLFLLPVLGREPIRWHPPQLFRIALLLVAMTPDTVVGIVLLQTSHDLFPMMSMHRPDWAPGAVADIQAGGGLMWAAGDGLMMTFAVGLVLVLIAGPERTDILGPWLEGVRRQTLNEDTGTDDDGTEDVDASERMLDAYNRMLGRLHEHER